MKGRALKTASSLLVAFSLMLSACSSSPANNNASQSDPKQESKKEEKKPEKLTVITNSNYEAVFQQIGQKFEKETGVKINVIATDYNGLHNKLVSSLAGGSSDLDIVSVDSIYSAEFERAGFIVPLDKYVTDDVKKQLVPITYEQRIYDNKLWAFPQVNEGKFLYYKEKQLKDAGYNEPPKTWEELIKMSKDMQSKGKAPYGIVWGWTQAEGLICDYSLLVEAFGGKMKDEKGNWVFNEGGGLKALEFMVNSLKDKVSDPASTTLNDRTVLNTFASSDIPFMLNWSFAVGSLKDKEGIKIALIPGTESAGKVSSSVTGGSGLGIAKASKNQDWAWKFIQYYTQRDNAVLAHEIKGNLPIWKDLYDNESLLKQYPAIKTMQKQFDYAVSRPNIPEYSDWSNILQVAIQKALIGEMSPKEALDGAKQTIEKKGIK